MKIKLIASILMLSGYAQAFPQDLQISRSLKQKFSQQSRGTEGVGGGDLCEMRIQNIRDDLASWIKRGGASKLQNLPVSANDYSKKMLSYLATSTQRDGSVDQVTDIECVHRPIEVQGHEKVCRFDRYITGPKITCYYEGFMGKNVMTEDDQYRLIHHEYAGLAKLENPDGSQSTYAISDQIGSFLEIQSIKKLVIKDQSNLNQEKISLYKKRFAKAITQQERSEEADHLECKLIAGGMAFGGDQTESEGAASKASDIILEATSVEQKTVNGRQVFTFHGRWVWGPGAVTAPNPHEKTDIIVTLSADNQRIETVLYNEYRDDIVTDTGDLANPSTITGWQLDTVIQCN